MWFNNNNDLNHDLPNYYVFIELLKYCCCISYPTYDNLDKELYYFGENVTSESDSDLESYFKIDRKHVE